MLDSNPSGGVFFFQHAKIMGDYDMATISEIIDRQFVKEDAAHHAGITMGQMLQWLPMLHLNPDFKRTTHKGRPRQMFKLWHIVTLAVYRTLTKEAAIDRSAAVKMIKRLTAEDIYPVVRRMQADSLDIQYMRVAGLRRFIKSLENNKDLRRFNKELRAKMKETRLQVRDKLMAKLDTILPRPNYWIVFRSGYDGQWGQPSLYFETGDIRTTEQSFFFSLAKDSRYFWAVNLGEVVGEVYRSILMDTEDLFYEMMDEVVGDELMDKLLAEG